MLDTLSYDVFDRGYDEYLELDRACSDFSLSLVHYSSYIQSNCYSPAGFKLLSFPRLHPPRSASPTNTYTSALTAFLEWFMEPRFFKPASSRI